MAGPFSNKRARAKAREITGSRGVDFRHSVAGAPCRDRRITVAVVLHNR
jgi:hypothetical protein